MEGGLVKMVTVRIRWTDIFQIIYHILRFNPNVTSDFQYTYIHYLRLIGLSSLHRKSGPAWKPGFVGLDVPLNLARSWDKKGVKGIKWYGLQHAK